MKNFKIAVCCGFSVAILAAAASAQMGGMGTRNGPTPHGFFNPVVGSGSDYEITSQDGKKTNMEYAIVGKETVDGKDGYWMEFTTTGAGMGGGPMVMKMLTVVGDSSVTTRVIMQMAGHPPMEMPSQMTSRMNGQQAQSATTDIRTSQQDVGSESITVPAGTFACEHYRAKDGSSDTWVSTKVSPLGVVKYQGKDSTMVLTQVVTDAKDKITGTPQPFNPMMMMQQGPPNQ